MEQQNLELLTENTFIWLMAGIGSFLGILFAIIGYFIKQTIGDFKSSLEKEGTQRHEDSVETQKKIENIAEKLAGILTSQGKTETRLGHLEEKVKRHEKKLFG